MEQNRIHLSTTRDLDTSLGAMRSERDNLQAEVDMLKAKLQFQEDSLVFEKTYDIHHMRRKTLEEAKTGIIDIDDCITKARELELTAPESLPAQLAATDYSSTGFEYSGIEDEIEENDDEGPGPEPTADLPASTEGRRWLSPPGLRRQ
nr:uncharacterized protein LOC108947534 [Nicotiana tomentosiformis]